MRGVLASGPGKGTLSAWRDPAVGAEVWYPVTGCKLAAHVPVRVTLDEPGYCVMAVIKKHPRRKVWWWFQAGIWCTDSKRWLRQEKPLAPVGCDPPWETSPHAFCPLDVASWPYPLPSPLDPALGPNTPAARDDDPAPDDSPHPHDGISDARLQQNAFDARLRQDDWPHFGGPLGRLTVPRTREECEARILRGFRTSNAQQRVGHGGSSLCADIPKEIVLASVRLNEMWWRVNPDADGSVYEALRSGWTPTERDIADWLLALTWLNHVEPRARRAVALRAADPPWSFRQIAERLRLKSHNTARALYAAAVDHAFASATQAAPPGLSPADRVLDEIRAAPRGSPCSRLPHASGSGEAALEPRARGASAPENRKGDS